MPITGRCTRPENFLYYTHVGIHARWEEKRGMAILQEEVMTTRSIPSTNIMLRMDNLIMQIFGKIIGDVPKGEAMQMRMKHRLAENAVFPENDGSIKLSQKVLYFVLERE